MRESKYWKAKKRRTCRLCGRERESWEHMWKGCRNWRDRGEESLQEECRKILGEDGKREKWLREIEEKKERGSRGRRREGKGMSMFD